MRSRLLLLQRLHLLIMICCQCRRGTQRRSSCWRPSPLHSSLHMSHVKVCYQLIAEHTELTTQVLSADRTYMWQTLSFLHRLDV
jgi:hypothetical protein